MRSAITLGVVATLVAISACGESEQNGESPVAPPSATNTTSPAGALASDQALAVGFDHVCAIDTAGQAWCWGSGASGALGTGSTASTTVPVAVSQRSLKFQRIAAGLQFTCALSDVGRAYCWGENGSGQIGRGTGAPAFVSVPLPVDNSRLKFSSIAVGQPFTTPASAGYACALELAGQVYCWGENDHGQLGNGTALRAYTPEPVSQGAIRFATLSAYLEHTCALSVAGKAYCWGRNAEGQLGDGTRIDRAVPVAVQGGLTFASIASFSNHTCAVTAAGMGYCWGDNTHGELGTGNTLASLTPVPSIQPGGLAVSAYSAGPGWATCAIAGSGGGGPAYCWGFNLYGNLGNGGTTGSAPNPTPSLVLGGLNYTVVSGGGFGATCGITPAGAAYCWGHNRNGTLGIGDALDRLYTSPQAVVGGHTFAHP